MMNKDSAFAAGTAIRHLKYPEQIKEIGNSQRAFDALRYISEGEYLTVTTVAILMQCSRMMATKTIKNLWMARLVKCVEVVTNTTPERLFKIWMISTKKLPKNANEACRLAALGMFYGRTKNSLSEYEWNIIRRSREKKYVTATIKFLPTGKKDKTTLSIDAPRRGEKPSPDSDIYIFPTIEEAKIYAPHDKRFTTDFILMNKAINYNNLISDPMGKS
ncbi:MAG: winged helix-turn-helix transcriptional regulator [Firmicutes bacterium]|nr:winged helix-turn-helix transcriptional regulator [Bacillota bacterium]